jgi:hypothetical protein
MIGNEISKLFVTIGAETSGFQKGIQGMSANLRKAGAIMTGVGAAITGSMIAITKQWANAGDEVQKLAEKTGFSTERLSELRYMADLSGTSLGTLETGLKRMATVIFDANSGMQSAVDSFSALGLSIQDLMGLNPEEQFNKIIGALANIEDPTIRAALAVELFGRAGTDLLPLLAEGSEGMNRMAQEARDMGVVFGREAADSAARFNDAITKVKTAFQGAGASVAENLAPILSDFLEKVAKVIAAMSQWAKEHPGLVKAIVLVVGALGAFMMAVGPILMVLPGIMALISGITAALPFLGAAFAVLTGPVGWAIAAFAALIAIGVLVYKNWDTIKEKATEIWGGIVSFFRNAWQSIVGTFESSINWIVDKINWFIEQLNKIPGVNLGELNKVSFGLPSFASGGIVPGAIGEPQLAVVHGGEFISPSSPGSGVTVNVYGLSVREEADIHKIARELQRELQLRSRYV